MVVYSTPGVGPGLYMHRRGGKSARRGFFCSADFTTRQARLRAVFLPDSFLSLCFFSFAVRLDPPSLVASGEWRTSSGLPEKDGRSRSDATGARTPLYPRHGAMFAGRYEREGGHWPRPSELWGRTMTDAPLLFERAPLRSAEGLRDPELIRAYFCLQALFSRDFSHRLAVASELLRPEYRRADPESREAFVRFLQQRICRTPCSRPVPRGWDLDTWACREESDLGYVANLRHIMAGLCDREEEPSVPMMAWDTPLMPPNYAVELERRKNPVMHGKLKFERRMRNRMRVFIAYEWVEVTSFERVVLHTRYPDLPTWLDQYEVPADSLAELPPCLVYHGFSMIEDPQSPK